MKQFEKWGQLEFELSPKLNGYLCELNRVATQELIVKAFFSQLLSKNLLERNPKNSNDMIINAYKDPDLRVLLEADKLDLKDAMIAMQKHLNRV